MLQALHIFRKDLRCFRSEVLLVFAGTMVCAWWASGVGLTGLPPWMVFAVPVIAATFVVIRVVLAEAPSGDSQFWLTRPYSRWSLLLSKVLFIVCCINVPLALGMIAGFYRAGFPALSVLPSLLLWQILALACWQLPVAGLAALTRSWLQALTGLLALIGISFFMLPRPILAISSPIAWIPSALAFGFLAVGSLAVLCVQYQTRKTLLSCGVAAVTVAIAIPIRAAMPQEAAMEVQTWLSPRSIDHSAMNVRFLKYVQLFRGGGLDAILNVDGIPEGVEARVDGVVGYAEAVGRSFSFSTGRLGFIGRPYPSESGQISAWAHLDEPAAKAIGSNPVLLRGSMLVTFFGDALFWSGRSSQTADLGTIRCKSDSCTRVTGSASEMVYLEEPSTHLPVLTSRSYSPFPEFFFLPLRSGISGAPYLRLADIDVKYVRLSPVSHFWLDFEVTADPILK